MRHTTAPLVEEKAYYPFGLLLGSISSRAVLKAKTAYAYNAGSEWEENGVEYYHTFFRKYDAQIGRFTGVDIASEEYAGLTPFQFGANNPVLFNDPFGDRISTLNDGIEDPNPNMSGLGNDLSWERYRVDWTGLNELERNWGNGGRGITSEYSKFWSSFLLIATFELTNQDGADPCNPKSRKKYEAYSCSELLFEITSVAITGGAGFESLMSRWLFQSGNQFPPGGYEGHKKYYDGRRNFLACLISIYFEKGCGSLPDDILGWQDKDFPLEHPIYKPDLTPTPKFKLDNSYRPIGGPVFFPTPAGGAIQWFRRLIPSFRL